MIAELMIILDLLKRRADTPSSTPTPTDPTRAKTVTPGSKASLGGGTLNLLNPRAPVPINPERVAKRYFRRPKGLN
jgi:hypothetical protein